MENMVREDVHVLHDSVGVAYDKNAANKRVNELPIKSLLQIVEQVLLLGEQQVAHVFGRVHGHWIGREQICARHYNLICC
jgi:hypothetical protein